MKAFLDNEVHHRPIFLPQLGIIGQVPAHLRRHPLKEINAVCLLQWLVSTSCHVDHVPYL